MRRLALALAAATVLASAVPASAQTAHAEFGFGSGWGHGGWWGGPYQGIPHAYSYGPGVEFYAGTRTPDTYAYADRPRRSGRAVRSRGVTPYDPGFDAYAYAPSYSYGGGHAGFSEPGFSAGFGFGPRHPDRWW